MYHFDIYTQKFIICKFRFRSANARKERKGSPTPPPKERNLY